MKKHWESKWTSQSLRVKIMFIQFFVTIQGTNPFSAISPADSKGIRVLAETAFLLPFQAIPFAEKWDAKWPIKSAEPRPAWSGAQQQQPRPSAKL